MNQIPKNLNEEKVRSLVKQILSEYKKDKELSITYVSNPFIKKMNKQFLNRDRTTDVIAFNLEESEDKDNILGDIYISHDQAKIQAEKYNVTYENELMRLTIHGVLHVLGYEDDTNKKKQIMHQQEDKWLGVYFA